MVNKNRRKRHLHLRHRISGTPEKPRLCVRRSDRHIFAQLVNDSQNRVLAGASSLTPAIREKKLKRMEVSGEVGRVIASRAKELGIKKVVFDRAGCQYHGRVKAVADGAREGGLKF
ncbi:50S ribosomal protein L18 [candidate division WOR-3 bacterium JGI_Cruoil_03_51_56]|uniref:Large ribosomal subunit protein uL18 n=1 Tax=candidate division WOR-3 bacterium JGI_Cruoil_03_51_56 TaxID=1973747 RepID=A0A235BUE0_UNCW3|nr:MAG: 50S ribosomal protein L18 [candidate division WOR-3 bacterium JGI_Cruoil_03_51_56]